MHLISFGNHFFTNQSKLAMKLTIILMMAAFLQVSATGHSQTINFSARAVSLKKAFKAIENQTENLFFFDVDLLKVSKPVTVELKNASLEQALSEIFKNQPLTWVIEDRTITVIKKIPAQKSEPVLPVPVEQPALVDLHGIVTTNEGYPLEGVSVIVVGDNKGAATNNKGEYSLKQIDENAKLKFSITGYEAQVIPVKGRLTINISLKINVVQQSEVVVIGYGTNAKKDLTGSVSSVSGAEMNKTPNALFDAALTGRAPGVQVVKSSGAPGAVASIRVRGGTSAIGTNEPLYVIDGVPIEMGDGFGNAAYQTDSRYKLPPIANINPEDIESIDILKDASSAAIYGSRAANGVIIVTTKKGSKSGTPMINFGYNNSFDKFAYYNVEMLNSDQYHQVVKNAYTNAGAALPANYIAYPGANTNWVDETTRTAVSNNIYLNVSGGSKDGSSLYSFSGGLTGQDGVIRFTDFERKNLRTSLETVLFKKLHFGTNINYSVTGSEGSGTGQFYLISKYRPDVPVYDDAGRYGASPDSVKFQSCCTDQSNFIHQ
jgi:TonB-dependent SusC/RagA subfamily outer membrane receptor